MAERTPATSADDVRVLPLRASHNGKDKRTAEGAVEAAPTQADLSGDPRCGDEDTTGA
jgi:hypothetical protein